MGEGLSISDTGVLSSVYNAGDGITVITGLDPTTKKSNVISVNIGKNLNSKNNINANKFDYWTTFNHACQKVVQYSTPSTFMDGFTVGDEAMDNCVIYGQDGLLVIENSTNEYNITIPKKSGTLALTSDITNYYSSIGHMGSFTDGTNSLYYLITSSDLGTAITTFEDFIKICNSGTFISGRINYNGSEYSVGQLDLDENGATVSFIKDDLGVITYTFSALTDISDVVLYGRS